VRRGNRFPEVPRRARDLGERISKADLLEAAWGLAAVCNDVGCDDEEATYQRLVAELNIFRAIRGEKAVRS
jgi:hypothetical protein